MPRRNISSASARRARYDDLDKHRILLLGGTVPPHFANRRWLVEVGRDAKAPRTPTLTINNVLGLLRACQRGLGIAMLPDYLVEENGGLVQLFGDADTLALDAYLRLSGRTQVGRAHPGVPRFPRRQRAAMEFLDCRCRQELFFYQSRETAWLTCG